MWKWMCTFGSLAIFYFLHCHSVSPRNPCDPLAYATVAEVFPSEEIDILLQFDKDENNWIQSKLKYVNCSARGLESIPGSIPKNVQLLDLSLNALSYFEQNAFSRFAKLVALSLSWNCPRNPSYNIFYCRRDRTILNESAFSGLEQLKLLNLSNNIFKVFPKGLPTSTRYLDISSTAITSMSYDAVSYLDHLETIVAKNLCPDNVPDLCPIVHIQMKPNTFEASNHSLKVLQFSYNNFFKHSLLTFSYPNLIALNLAQTRILIPSKLNFLALTKLKYLNFNYLYPNQDIYVYFSNGTFDLLTKLEFLDLSNNMIKEIHEDLFQFNQNLTFLELSGNCLFRVIQDPTFLKSLRFLRFLYLGFNYCSHKNQYFEKLPFSKPRINNSMLLGSTFSRLSSLELLSFGLPHRGTSAVIREGNGLSFNVVNAESLLALKHLPNLHTLSIAYCTVKKFDIISIENFSNISKFDLSHNFIRSVTIGPTNSTIDSSFWQHSRNFFTASPAFGKLSSSIDSPMIANNRQKISQSNTETFSLVCSTNNILDLSENFFPTFRKVTFPFNISIYNFITWLDLSSNLVMSIGDRAFAKWKKVCGINLKDNPLRYIHHKAFDDMDNLHHILLNSTKLIDQSYQTLQFLNHVKSSFHLQMTNGHFFMHFSSKFTNKTLKAVSVDLSGSEIVSKTQFEKAFRSFPNLISIILKSCGIPFINFNLSNEFVTNLDLRENKILGLPTHTLENMPKLRFLLLSKNFLFEITWKFAKFNPDLEELDVSFNQITFISESAFNPVPKNMSKLWLNNNYLSQIGIELLSKKLLDQLYYFDLRWNDVGCDCKLTKTIGWWLLQYDFNLQDRPGFTPFCTPILDRYLGGCTVCQQPQIGTSVSLLAYSCNKSCEEFLPKVMCYTFLVCSLIFLILGYIISSPKWKALLSHYFLEDIISASTSNLATITKRQQQIFLYHVFICFDLRDQVIGDWVDNCLVPNIDPLCNVLVIGKHNHCGIPPATQLLFGLEASRKTLMILSGNYGLSQECKYIFAVLKYLEYKTGGDRLLIISFRHDNQARGLVDKHRLFKPWSVFNVPDEREKWQTLWKCLNTMI